MKRVILVLGAQRSGTSVTSHVLSELGVQFGHRNRFIQFDHNPIFFELKWINDRNNQIVDAIGHHYIDFFLPLESDWTAPTVQPQIEAIQSDLDRLIQQEWHDDAIDPNDSQDFVIGIKDPRISLTFPVWEAVLQQRGYAIQIVHAFRSPIGFLHSNQKLFEGWEGWTIDRHLHFWLQLNLASIYFTRHYPLHLLNYDHLMQFPEAEITRLVSALSLDASLIPTASMVIQTQHYHHSDRSPLSINLPWINQIYQKLCDGTIGPDDYLNYRQDMRTVSSVSSVSSGRSLQNS